MLLRDRERGVVLASLCRSQKLDSKGLYINKKITGSRPSPLSTLTAQKVIADFSWRYIQIGLSVYALVGG